MDVDVDVDVTDPDYELVWPKELFKTETLSLLRRPGDPAEEFTFLLEDAFVGDTPANDFRQQATPTPQGFGSVPGAEDRARKLIASLLNQTDKLRTPDQRVPYWHQRWLSPDDEIRAEDLQQAWAEIVRDLESRGYFYRDLEPCVDGSAYDEYIDHMQRKIFQIARLDVSWPLPTREPVYGDSDRFFGLVECLFDLVARPRSRCITHGRW